MRKGDAYSFEFIQEGRKKLVKMQKVLELGYEVESIQVHSEKSMIFAVSKAGLISSYAADLIEMNVITIFYIEILADNYGQSEFGAGIQRHQKQQKSHIDC
jgi:hypothetical protein